MKVPQKYQEWLDARTRYKLSHAQVQMARELGMNPKTFGKIANHDQQPWKAPLPQFIENLYFKRFDREQPELVQSIEERVQAEAAKKAIRREARSLIREQAAAGLAGEQLTNEARDTSSLPQAVESPEE